MKLYAWKSECYGRLSFFVMAETEEEAREAVHAYVGAGLRTENKRDFEYADWPNSHTLKVFERGQVIDESTG